MSPERWSRGPTNSDRAASAILALTEYRSGCIRSVDELEEALTDLLTDLLHAAKSQAIPPHALLDRARMHYDCEADQGDET